MAYKLIDAAQIRGRSTRRTWSGVRRYCHDPWMRLFQGRISRSAAVPHHELTTVLTTTMTTVGLPDTSTYTTIELVSCLVTPPARAYGSEGWEFESLRARFLPAETR
jgi:hypothetical protein